MSNSKLARTLVEGIPLPPGVFMSSKGGDGVGVGNTADPEKHTRINAGVVVKEVGPDGELLKVNVLRTSRGTTSFGGKCAQQHIEDVDFTDEEQLKELGALVPGEYSEDTGGVPAPLQDELAAGVAMRCAPEAAKWEGGEEGCAWAKAPTPEREAKGHRTDSSVTPEAEEAGRKRFFGKIAEIEHISRSEMGCPEVTLPFSTPPPPPLPHNP